jgi:hypothetical protein
VTCQCRPMRYPSVLTRPPSPDPVVTLDCPPTTSPGPLPLRYLGRPLWALPSRVVRTWPAPGKIPCQVCRSGVHYYTPRSLGTSMYRPTACPLWARPQWPGAMPSRVPVVPLAVLTLAEHRDPPAGTAKAVCTTLRLLLPAFPRAGCHPAARAWQRPGLPPVGLASESSAQPDSDGPKDQVTSHQAG